MSHEYTSAAEDAASIRKALKAKGWTSRQISVKSDTFSMGSSIDVTIKAAGISKKEVEKIANRFDDVRRDENGDILSGGNRYVSVTFDHDLLAARALKFRPIIDATPICDSSSTRVIAAGREFYVIRPERWRVTLAEHGEGGETCQCMGEDVAACQLAQIDLESGTDEPAKPADYEADPEVYACPDGPYCGDPKCREENARRAAVTPISREQIAATAEHDAPAVDIEATGQDAINAMFDARLEEALVELEEGDACGRYDAPFNREAEPEVTPTEPPSEPGSLYSIWSHGTYVGQLQAVSSQAARWAFLASYETYYPAHTLVALRVRPA